VRTVVQYLRIAERNLPLTLRFYRSAEFERVIKKEYNKTSSTLSSTTATTTITCYK
jgi:hypothetical protein